MDLGISGRRALVTGGASGIGFAVVRELVKEGAYVAFSSRKDEHLQDAMHQLESNRDRTLPVISNITDSNGPKKLADHVKQHWGGVDIIVNNVGDTLGITDEFCTIEDWRKIFRLNLEVHIEVNNEFIPYMRSKNWGRIVNITAGAALENSGPVPYCTVKAAHTAYTRSMARVLAPHGIVMCSVLPGVVITEHGHWQSVLEDRPEHAEQYLEERTRLKRFGRPDEISGMVAFLCSERASFCVGSTVPVEGGQARHYFVGNTFSI